MLNRTVAPLAGTIDQINFIRPIQRELENGIPVYIMNGGDQEMLRVEFLIENNLFDPQKPLKGMAVAALLKNGTRDHTAKQIVEMIDHYGAFLDAEYSSDNINVTLYVLAKHYSSVVPILLEVMTRSIFPEEELEIYIRNQKQKFLVNLQKNDFLVKKAFAHEVFGDTPYGIDIQMAHYDSLERADLLEYYSSSFVPGNYSVILSGNIQEHHVDVLNGTIGKLPQQSKPDSNKKFKFTEQAGKQILIERPEALQSAIRLGNRSINRSHADFPGLSVLCCALGGYFGSRLMTNIREDKGFTYGIGAALIPMKHSGQFFITTEVGTDVCAQALTEIYKEIDILKSTLIPDEELELVKSFMLGSLLGSLENIFSHTQKFKNLFLSGMDYSYYERYIETVKNIDPATLKELANKYLDTSKFVELVVGKR